MNYSTGIFLLCCIFFQTACSGEQKYRLESMQDLLWEKRVILVHSSGESKEVVEKLKTASVEIDDRHIYWFVFEKDRVLSNYSGKLEKKFQSNTLAKYFKKDEFSVLLIGKDGGVKDRAKKLELEALFALIDTMPMRRSEMRNDNSN